MTRKAMRSSNDELIIGVCGGIGANLKNVISVLKEEIERFDFIVSEIELTDSYKYFTGDKNHSQLRSKDRLTRLDAKIKFGTHLCELTGSSSIHAQIAIALIRNSRDKAIKRVFIVNQLKRPHEYLYLKKIYGRSFLLIGVYEDEDVRLNALKELNRVVDCTIVMMLTIIVTLCLVTIRMRKSGSKKSMNLKMK